MQASSEDPRKLAGEFWGGLAAMLVALPSAIAFGVTIFSPLGASYSAQGALAGIIGATAIGLVAASLGGAKRLISAPCAPAAAVMGAFALELTRKGVSPQSILPMMMVLAILCGAIQVIFGLARLGRLIKYMPYPVVSGYLSGVGLIIIISQVPRFLGLPKDAHLGQALTSPSNWNWNGIAIGVVTVVVMVAAPRFTKALPAAILGLGAGVLTYFALGLVNRSLLTLAGNSLVVGALGSSGMGFIEAVAGRWKAFGALGAAQLRLLATPALTLAVLLSIDTLKTCIVLDTLTRSRHDSNRELIGQGLGNVASAVCGGVPGSGTMGATLVNLSSGGATRLSGMIEGGLALVAFLVLGNLIAWVPISALAGILIVIGFRMLDRKSVHLLRSRSTVLDFAVIVAVVVVAETISLIAASAVGVALAILLFIREEIGGSVVRRKTYGNVSFSKQARLPDEMAILEKRGAGTVIFELQGSLFFGTTDQLYTDLEPELKTKDCIILDLRRVKTVDITAVHLLQQIQAIISERKGLLIFSNLPHSLPSGRDLQDYFDEVGLVKQTSDVPVFGILAEALEWVEDRILAEEYQRASETPLELREIDMFRGRKEETLAALESCAEKQSFQAGEKIFSAGEPGDHLFLIRKGGIRIVLPLSGNQHLHLATFGRGDFFGEMSFLDHAPRSANAVALTDTDVYVLSRERFDNLAEEHKKLALTLLEGLARALAIRMRHTTAELRSLEEN